MIYFLSFSFVSIKSIIGLSQQQCTTARCTVSDKKTFFLDFLGIYLGLNLLNYVSCLLTALFCFTHW